MYKTRRTKKARNIRKHFHNRCLERIGFALNENELIKKIQNNDLEFVRRTSNTRTVFKYWDDLTKKNYNVIYDKFRHLVVTIYESRLNNKVS